MKPFRIESIHLDEDHDVSGITVVLDAPYLPQIEKAIFGDKGGNLEILRRERGDTELWVRLDTGQLMQLFREAGDSASEHFVPGCFYALGMVVYGLMEE